MPDLTQALNAKIAAEQAEKAQAKSAEQSARDAKDSEAFGRLDRLSLNADWQWFCEMYLDHYVSSEARMALDIKKSPEERSNHAHRHDIALEIVGKLEKERTRLMNRLK